MSTRTKKTPTTPHRSPTQRRRTRMVKVVSWIAATAMLATLAVPFMTMGS